MFGLSWVKIGIYGAIISAIVTVSYLGYRHYNNLLETISVLEKNNARLEVSVQLQQDTIDTQQQAIANWESAQTALISAVHELARVNEQATAETRRLTDVFTGHDLNALALRRPGLIERRVDRGTADVLRMLECASGAERQDCPD